MESLVAGGDTTSSTIRSNNTTEEEVVPVLSEAVTREKKISNKKKKKTKSEHEVNQMINDLIKSAKPYEDITYKIREINKRYYRPKFILTGNEMPLHPLFLASAKTKRRPIVEQIIFDKVCNHTLKCLYDYFNELKEKFSQLHDAVVTMSVSNIILLFF